MTLWGYEENPIGGRCFQYLATIRGEYVMSRTNRGIEWGKR